MTKTTWRGVITGDIVGSQQLSDTDYQRVLSTLEQQLGALCDRFSGRFDIFRGDAFQLQLPDPAYSMLVATALRLHLKALPQGADIRQCVGLGSVSGEAASPKRATGEAFVLSGNGLDAMKTDRLTLRSANPDFDERFTLLTRYLDVQLNGLTAVQSQVLSHYLLHSEMSHEALAASLNKTRSNVTRILLAANYHLVTDYLTYFQRHVSKEGRND